MLSKVPDELVFEVMRGKLGAIQASCLNAPLVIEAGDWVQLHDDVTSAVAQMYAGQTAPRADQIHFVLYED